MNTLDTDHIYTVAEVAKELGVTYERVRQQLAQAERRGKPLGRRRKDGAYAGVCWEITAAGLEALTARRQP